MPTTQQTSLPVVEKHTIDFLASHYDLPPATAWLLCEPVELVASNHEIICLGNAHLSVTIAEAASFAATLNAYWEGSGMMLYTPTPSQWLLALSSPTAFDTPSLGEVVNQPIPRQLPPLFLQAQMLMQGHAVNRARQGVLPLVNGLWMSVSI
jgi:hypothetical protein